MVDTQDSLLKLADRIDALADQRERVINGDGSKPGGRADLREITAMAARCGRKVDRRSPADCTFVIAATPGHST
jgi:hypothetical protein